MEDKTTAALKAELRGLRDWTQKYGTHGARSLAVRRTMRQIRAELDARKAVAA